MDWHEERDQYTAILTEKAWSITGFQVAKKRPTQKIPRGPRWIHRARSGSQSEHRIRVILPAIALTITIIPHSPIDSEAMRAREIIVLVKSN